MKRAFTLIEMAMVVAVLSILVTLITTAASNSMKAARAHRANAAAFMVQAAIDTYHTQENEWPISFAGKQGDPNDDYCYALTAAEVRTVVKKIVDKTKEGNAMIDVSGLFVSRYDDGKHRAIEFMTAVRGTPESPKRMNTSEMHFGYAERERGIFHRFRMKYSIPTDQLTVLQPYSDSDIK